MNFDEYQMGVLRTANQNQTKEQSILNAALGLGEAGEVQNLIKKAFFHGHQLKALDIIDELGDVLYYVTWMAALYGLDLEMVAEYNQHKLRKRFPEGFSVEASIARVDVNS